MKKIKLGFLLSSALLLAACSGGGDSAETDGEDLANTEDNEEETVTFEGFGIMAPAATTAWKDMEIMQELEDNVNVEIDWTNPTPSTADEQTNLMFASNDLPDFLFSAWTLAGNELAEYGGNGQLIPLEDLVEEHAPNMKAFFDARPEVKSVMTAPDGHIYAIPQYDERPFKKMPGSLIINRKWLDEVGLDMPETTDEFKETLVAFKEADLSEQGDTIPFTFVLENPMRSPFSLSGSFGVVGEFEGIEDEEIFYAPAKDEYRDYVDWMHELYAEGLIDPEAFTQDHAVLDSKIQSDEEFVGTYFSWSAYGDHGDSDRDFEFVPPLKGPEGHQGWISNEGTMSQSGFSITSVNENPVRAIKWADQFYEPDMSVEISKGLVGHALEIDDDGNYVSKQPPEGQPNGEFVHEQSPASYAAYAILEEQYDKIVLNKDGEEKMAQLEAYGPVMPEEVIPEFIYSPEDAKRIDILESDINDYTYEMLAKFMMEGFDEQEYDDFVDQLDKLGLSELIEIKQSYYDEFLSNLEK